MRWFLFVLSMPTGAASLLMFIVALTKDGSDIQIIGSGVFLTAFVLAVGLIGVMARLEEIRDNRKE